MEKAYQWSFNFLGFPVVFDVAVMISTVVACAIVLLLGWLAVRNRTLIPKGVQNAIEIVIDFTRGMVRANLDPKTSELFYSFTFTVFFFVLISNELGLIFSYAPSIGGEHFAFWKSPTANINVTLAMALAITLVAHYLGIRKSPKKYVKHYFKPFAWMFPLHLIDEVTRPVTHGLRLWANIFAGEVLIVIMLKANPFLIGAPFLLWLAYSFLVGIIQAYVFTILALVYVSLKTSADEH